jgi:hypothetical protein
MKYACSIVTLACCLSMGGAGTARAGAPQPDTRQGEFVHVCQGGPNAEQLCTVPTQAQDCPRSTCVVRTLSRPISGKLTLIAHDGVTDWLHGGSTNQALTVLLEVRGPDGNRELLSATYQDLTAPANPPEAPSNVVAIAMDEFALQTLAGGVDGLRFVQPDPALAQRLQTLFGLQGTPVIVAASERRVESADHTQDGLATVLRFKVRVQFVEPL